MLKRPQRKRPLGIKLVAGAYLGFPVLGPLFMWLTYRNAPDSVLRMVQSITPASLLVMASVVLVGYGISQVRPWGWYLFLGHSAFILAHNVWVYRSTGAVSLGLLIAANSALLAVAGMIIHSNVRAPYFNPRLRYWEQKPRVAVRLQANLGGGDDVLEGETFDVSESGAFVCCATDTLQVGEARPFALAWPGDKLSCDAEIVWKSAGDRDVPAGVGIRFNRLDRAQRSKLHALVKQFIAQRQATIPPPPQRSPWAIAAVALSAVALVAAGVFALHGLRAPQPQPVSIDAPTRHR